MSTIAEHIAARNDTDLQQRLIAAAEMHGVADPARWVTENLGALVCANIDGTTLADVHAFAVVDKGEPPLSAGADPAFVTDDQVKAAVSAIRGGTGS